MAMERRQRIEWDGDGEQAMQVRVAWIERDLPESCLPSLLNHNPV
jgi:hypothetical protein